MSAGLFLAVLSTTVVSVALPTIGRSLRASPADLEWIADAYMLIYASLLAAGGALGDRLGRKGLFMLGVRYRPDRRRGPRGWPAAAPGRPATGRSRPRCGCRCPLYPATRSATASISRPTG
jgi:hypothetical protein